MQRLAIVTAAALLGAAPAAAQFGNSGFLAPDTKFDRPGVPAPHQINNTDVLFAQLLSEGGMAEVELAQLAPGKSHTKAIEDFAARMVRDHTKANQELEDLAKAAGIALPDELSGEHKKMRASLDKMEGPQFDAAYIAGQVVDHVKAAQLLAWEIDSGEDAALQKFAAATLPTVLEHLGVAQDLLIQTRQLAAK